MSTQTNRIEFHNMLCNAVGAVGNNPSVHIYFQIPENIQMQYPAIQYERTGMRISHANNNAYAQATVYRVTVMDQDPDSDIVTKISKIPTARFIRHFTTSGLNHDVFEIYYK